MFDGFAQADAGGVAGEGDDAGDIGDAALDVFEAWLVGLFVGNEVDAGRRAGDFDDEVGEAADCDFGRVAEVEDFARRIGEFYEAAEPFDDVADVGEGTGLLAGAVDGKVGSGEGVREETRHDHAVASGLARADGVEEACGKSGDAAFMPVGEGEELVDDLAGGVAPARLGGGAEEEIVVFAKGGARAFAVDLGGGGDDDFSFAGSCRFEDAFGAVDVIGNGFDRGADDVVDADGGGEVEDGIGFIDKGIENGAVGNGRFDKAGGGAKVGDVGRAAARKVIEQGDAVAAEDQRFGEVGTDETGSARDEVVCHSLRRGLPNLARARRLRKPE